MAVFETILGVIVLAVVLLDVFLTVLYARMGSSILARRVAHAVWRCFRLVQPKSASRGVFLSFCGPVVVLSLLAMWFLGLTIGAGLIIHPQLGSTILATTGGTPHDFISALYAGADNITIIGSNSFVPVTSGARTFYLIDSLIGTTITSLTISYIMQVYSGLQRRNTLGLKLDLLSGSTGDAADLLAGLAPRGNATAGYTNIAEMAAEIAAVKEAHHFYPVLFYFRFKDAFYAVSHISLMSADMVSLIKAAMDDEEVGWLKESASVTSLWQGSLALAIMLDNHFARYGSRESEKHGARIPEPDDATLHSWSTRYDAALTRLRQAGVSLRSDVEMGRRIYLRERARWNCYTASLAPVMGYDMGEIDPACERPQTARERPPFGARMHTTPAHGESESDTK